LQDAAGTIRLLEILAPKKEAVLAALELAP
jgi:hypothetical protein